MITEEKKSEIKAEGIAETKKRLREDIELGVSSERLAINSDWLKFKASIEANIAMSEKDKIGMYDSILSGAVVGEEKLKAIDAIRYRNWEMENFKFIIGLVAARVKRGEEARAELDKLEEEKS